MKLLEERKEFLNSRIGPYFETSHEIMIRDLINHTSGLINYFDLPNDALSGLSHYELCHTILMESNIHPSGQYKFNISNLVLVNYLINDAMSMDKLIDNSCKAV